MTAQICAKGYTVCAVVARWNIDRRYEVVTTHCVIQILGHCGKMIKADLICSCAGVTIEPMSNAHKEIGTSLSQDSGCTSLYLGNKDEASLHDLTPVDEDHAAHSPLLWWKLRAYGRDTFSEFFGTMILILFGDGVVAQVLLSHGQKGDYQSISWGWG